MIAAQRRAELERAYRATTYGAGSLAIRIGERSVALDAMLAHLHAVPWAYLTAWNPGSIPRAEAENEAAMTRLRDALAARGLDVIQGEATADDGTWREPSFLVLGLHEEEAVGLGREFGQVAIVAGKRNEAPRLVWI